MTTTARSAVFLFGLLLVLGGLASAQAAPALALASIVLGALLVARSGVPRALPVAAAIILFGLAAEVLVVAVPPPVDWPMLAVAGLAVMAGVGLLRSGGRANRAA